MLQDHCIGLPPLSPHQAPVPVYVIGVKHTHTCMSLSIGEVSETIAQSLNTQIKLSMQPSYRAFTMYGMIVCVSS